MVPLNAAILPARARTGPRGCGTTPGRSAGSRALVLPTGRRFPCRSTVRDDGGRSRIPLLGSSGFAPDFILPRPNTGTMCTRHYMKGEQGESTEGVGAPVAFLTLAS